MMAHVRRLLVGVAMGIAVSLVVAGAVWDGVSAQEDAGGAELAYACTPSGAATGEDTLLRCTATARNTGSEPLANAHLNFAPSDLPIPDRYYFFRYRLNGEERPTSSGALSYAFGNIAPGDSSRIELDIIVRVTQRSGAGVQLVSYPSPSAPIVHDSATVAVEALEGGVAALVMRIVPVTPVGPDGAVMGPLNVVLENNTGAQIDGVAVEVAWDEGVRLVADSAGTWEIDVAARRARATVDAPAGTSALPLEFAPDGSECGFVTTAGTDTWDGATTAALADFGYQVGDCPAFGHGGGGDVVSPPAPADSAEASGTGRVRAPDTGTGTGSRAASWWPLAVVGVAGLATSFGGAVLLRQRR